MITFLHLCILFCINIFLFCITIFVLITFLHLCIFIFIDAFIFSIFRKYDFLHGSKSIFYKHALFFAFRKYDFLCLKCILIDSRYFASTLNFTSMHNYAFDCSNFVINSHTHLNEGCCSKN